MLTIYTKIAPQMGRIHRKFNVKRTLEHNTIYHSLSLSLSLSLQSTEPFLTGQRQLKNKVVNNMAIIEVMA